MKHMFRYMAALAAIVLAMVAILGVGGTASAGNAATEGAAAQAALALGDYFTDRDLAATWDADKAVAITLSGDTASCDSGAVQIDGGDILITQPGVYVLTGTLDDGTITVNAEDDVKVQLVLAGVSITSSDSAAILVENADKVFVTLAEGTENTLVSSGFDASSGVDAVVFARDDITFNGTGALTVVAQTGNGISGKDDVKFASGSYTVTAEAGRGIDANDSVRVAGGSFTIVSGKDAIRAKNTEDEGKGYVLIFDGSFTITSGGGAQNAAAHADDMRGFGARASTASDDTASAKAVKASGSLVILGGSFDLDAADDAIHSDDSVTIYGGTIVAASGDDGIHANGALVIEAGSVSITQSYEGLEGQTIDINGGDIIVNASDDGLNAAGGSDESGFGYNDMFASQEGVAINITGGTIYVNASGDGIDSNGDLTVSGGTVVVSGPTGSGNGALDYNGNAIITGGTVIAAGSTGMAENFSDGSTQVAALVNLSGQAGDITVTDANGGVLFSGMVEKSFDCVVVSSPDMAVGETYTVTASGGSAEVEITQTVTGKTSGMGGMGPRTMEGGFGGRGMGGMQAADGQATDGGFGGPNMGGMQAADGQATDGGFGGPNMGGMQAADGQESDGNFGGRGMGGFDGRGMGPGERQAQDGAADADGDSAVN